MLQIVSTIIQNYAINMTKNASNIKMSLHLFMICNYFFLTNQLFSGCFSSVSVSLLSMSLFFVINILNMYNTHTTTLTR